MAEMSLPSLAQAEDCLIRVWGRDIKSTDSLGITTKHLIILSPKSHMTKLLVRQVHITSCHRGLTVMMSILAAQYLIPAAKQMINQVSADSITCKKVYAKTLHPETCSTTSSTGLTGITIFDRRTELCRAIPLSASNRRKPVMLKCYVCLIICFVSTDTH